MARGNDSIYFTVWASLAVFATLSLVFDAIRKRIWWVYEPRNHHAAFKARTPPPPAAGILGWVPGVLRLWADEDFLIYAGVDGVVIIYFMRFCVEQCLFASVVGCGILVPAYMTSDGLATGGEEGTDWSFSLTTVENLRCRSAVGVDGCANNGASDWRYALVVVAAWLFTLRALASLGDFYQRFVHLRHWYLTAGLSDAAPPGVAQRALTVRVERLPRALRSDAAVAAAFERLCGAGSVHSARVVLGGLGRVAARNRGIPTDSRYAST